MTAQELQKSLTDYTVANCGFEEKRNYVSMSNIFMEPEELVRQYQAGYSADTTARLKCYKGYQMELDLKRRIAEIFILPNPTTEILLDPEFSSSDRLFKCHPDLMIDGYPADCKSVLKDEWIPESFSKVSRKIKYQMQGQMMLSKTKQSFIIYESRESGLIKVIDVYINEAVVGEIIEKMEAIRKLLKIHA